MVPCPMDKGRRCARGEPGPDTSDAAKPKDKIHLLLLTLLMVVNLLCLQLKQASHVLLSYEKL